MFGNEPLTPQFRAYRARQAWDADAPLDPPPPPETTVEYTAGLDLGKSRDFSVLCVVERAAGPQKEPTYAVRHLRRWPLGTPYTRVAEEAAKVVYHPDLRLPRLAVDATGVGQAVVEMVRGALTQQPGTGPRALLAPVVIAGGHAIRRAPDGTWHVGKVQLVSVLDAVVRSRRLKIAAGLAHAPTLAGELRAFREKRTDTGHSKFEALQERLHDDMVLALALALWLADRVPRGRFEIW